MADIAIASDHAGFHLKESLKKKLARLKPHTSILDLGPDSDSRVDYPDFSEKVVEKILHHPNYTGILICGSGQGMAMSANRHKGIRAALCWNEESAKLARAHNNANVLCLGARLIAEDLAWEISKVFLETEFEAGRHVGRLNKF